jgi:hypothetical protein
MSLWSSKTGCRGVTFVAQHDEKRPEIPSAPINLLKRSCISAFESLALFQSGAAQPFQIMLLVNVAPHRHLGCNPGQRNIWLGPAELL